MDNTKYPGLDPAPISPMDPEAFRKWGKAMVDKVADYWISLPSLQPQPNVAAGSIRDQFPKDPPQNGEPLEAIFEDVDKIILPGTTHWHHPHFFAYYPLGNSYPAILGDILCSGITCNGFSWNCSPVSTELEMVTMDWLAKALGLPKHFLFESGGKGGGVIQGTSSECALLALLAARSRALNNLKDRNTIVDLGHLMVYTSEEAHSCIERAALLAALPIRKLPTDDIFALRGATLAKAIAEDRSKGFIPIAVIATLGTTSTCAFDKLDEIGPICQENNLWLHVDAAYAGSAFICPEFRYLMAGIEFVDSFSFDAHKFLLINMDCTALWFKNSRAIEDAFKVDPLYLKHDQQGLIPDYRHWQIPLSRRFRSLKLWFTMRAFGVVGLQEYIRSCCKMAQKFVSLVREDPRFEIVAPVVLGLVAFRLKGSDVENEKLLKNLNDDGGIFIVPTILRGKYVLRLSIGAATTTEADVDFAWQVILQTLAKQQLPHAVVENEF